MEPQASWTGLARVKVQRDERDHFGLSGNMTATAGNAMPPAADPKLVAAPPVQRPSSRLPAEQAAVQGGCNQQQNQEGDDSDTDSLSSASSSIAERAAPKATAPTETAGFWTASTASKAMRKLVRIRAEIFAAQRKARDDPLQTISREKVETAFSQSAASNGPYLSGFRNYMAFCARVDVPPFPLTSAMMALWLFEKCSVQNGYFHTYKHGVGLAADIAESLWTTHPVYRTMRRFDKDGTALSEFLEERRVTYKSSLSNASPKSVAKAASKPREAPRKFIRIDSDASSSPSTDGEHSEYASDGDAGSEAHTDEEEEVDDMEPVVVRGLPTRDSVYDSITDIYKTYVAAIVPVYGISVVALKTGQKNVYIKCNRYHSHYTNSPGGMCPWSALCRRRPDGKYIVDFDASTFKHSHGPCKEILADPEWRPVVRNPDARAVLGMDPLPNQTRYKKHTSDEPTLDEPPHKKARRSATTSSAKVMLPPPVPTHPPTSVAPRPQPPSLAATPHWSPSAQHSYPSPVSPSTPQGSSARSAGTPVLKKPVSAIATSSHKAPRISSPLATWNPTPSVRPSSQPPVVAAATPVGVGSPSAHDDPFELVSAFCAGLHPSLVALAEPLVAAGVHSFDGLVALRVLGPHQLDHFLADLRKTHSEHRAKSPSLPPLSNVHILLFAKYLRA